MRYSGFGYLSVIASVAEGAAPISGASVRVLGVDEENRDEEAFAITDIDGKAGPLRLIAPDAIYSEAPTPKEKPYAVYEVLIKKSGYYDKLFRGVAVFDGITTVIEANMIPGISGVVISGENTESNSQENPYLE